MLSKARFPQAASLPKSTSTTGSRRRILEAALDLFATQGYDGSSVRDLANLLKFRPSALYAHFRTKEEIFAELMHLGHESEWLAIEEALRTSGSDANSRMSTVVRAVVHWTVENPHLAVVMYADLHSIPSELVQASLAIRNRSAGLLVEIVEAGIAEGCFSVPHVLTAAAAIGAMGIRIPYWYPPLPPQPPLDAHGLANAQVRLALQLLGGQRQS